jgi:Pyridoxamine 5'-phosphate oxidase
MSDDRREEVLRTQRTCRVATIGAAGHPHATALWFVWDGQAIWLNSLSRTQRWTDLQRDPRVSVLVDGGEEFLDLYGIEIIGTATPVGEVPRTGEPVEELREPERLFGAKYAGGEFRYDGRHAWLRVAPTKVVSWDFTRMTRS